jgi:RimJ/RimL family protein N-acetyltransferase
MDHSELKLRPMNRADAEILGIWAEDELFCQHAGWTTSSAAAVRDFWVRQVETPPADLIRLAVASADDGLLGYVDLHGAKPLERELGFLIGPSTQWGRGLGGRAAKAGLVYGFEQLSLGSIWAEALIANAASVRILRSLGMRETGRGCAETFLEEESCYLQFRISRDEWSTSRLER